MSRDRSKCNKLTDSKAWIPQMTPFPFWWTNNHTCTLEETVCYCPVACSVTGHFALPNPAGTVKDGMNHYCHLPHMINQRDRATRNELRLVSCHQDGSHVCSFAQFFGRICFALATSSCWYCPDDSDVKAESPRIQAWVRHRPVKPYFSVKCDSSRGGPFRGECDQLQAVKFWHVNNSGLCASHLVNLLSRWLPRQDTLCIWKKNLNHNWYDVLFKENCR